MKKINVIIQKANGTMIKTTIKNTLKELQHIVGGAIEYPYIEKLSNKNISLIVNDEGKLLELDPCLALVYRNEIVDYVCGDIIFVGTKSTDDGLENDNLSDEQIEFIQSKLFSNLKCLLTKDKRSIGVIEL